MKPAGPWWIASFAEGGRSYVICFRLDRGGAVDPLHVAFIAPRDLTALTPRLHQVALNQARAFAALHRPLIEDALAIAGDIDKARAYGAAQGYAALEHGAGA